MDTQNTQDSSDERQHRHYEIAALPILRSDAPRNENQDLLLGLYSEICKSWRMLTDVRFKLLGLVPTVSIIAVTTLLSRSQSAERLSRSSQSAIIVFGFLVTLGLWVYELRNSYLYIDLVNRGGRIEDEPGIDTGQFRGRLNPSNRLINHKNATRLIYWTTLASWVFAFMSVWLGWTT